MMDDSSILWVLGHNNGFVTTSPAFGKRDYMITFGGLEEKKPKSALDFAKSFFDRNPSFERSVENVHAFLTSKVSSTTPVKHPRYS